MKNGFRFEGVLVTVLKVAHLRLDSAYQRTLNNAVVRDNSVDGIFDEKALNRGVVVSLRRDGYYYIIDGQHRYSIAIKRGKKQILCIVHEGLSKEQEAALFVKLNNMKTVNRGSKFRANHAAGCPRAKQIVQTVRGAGFDIAMNPGRPTKGSNVLTRIGCVEYVWDNYQHVFEKALQIIKEVYPNGDTGAVQSTALEDVFLRGFAYYLHERQGNAEDVIQAMMGQDADGFKRHVQEIRPGVRGKDAQEIFAEEVEKRVQSYQKRFNRRR